MISATITHNGKLQNLGLFVDPAEAHEAYRAAAVSLFGEYANFGKVDKSKAENFIFIRTEPVLKPKRPKGIRPAGRPKKIDQETTLASFNLTKSQIAWLKSKSGQTGVSASEALRNIINDCMLNDSVNNP